MHSSGTIHIDLYSSVTGAAFWRALLAALRERGFATREVGVLDHDDHQPTGTLRRRWAMYAGYAAKLRRHAARSDADAHIVTTNPFYAPWLVQRRRKPNPHAKTVCLLYDLFPDALEVAGLIRRDGPASRLLAALTRQTFARSDAVVFLGERLRDHAITRYGQPKLSAVIPVGADHTAFENHPPNAAEQAPIDILYCGQLGRMHEVDTLRDYLTQQRCPASIRFRFHGRGPGIEKLRPVATTHPKQLSLGDPLPDAAWRAAMQSAPVALVTLREGAQTVCLPSKTYSALAAGQAVLAICPPDSDLADLIRQYDAGWVVPPGDADALALTLREITEQSATLATKRDSARRAGQGPLAMPAIAKRWEELLMSLES